MPHFKACKDAKSYAFKQYPILNVIGMIKISFDKKI